MTIEQRLIKRVVAAAEHLPNNTPYDEFINESPENKEWADAFNELRNYDATVISVEREFKNLTVNEQ